MIVFASTSHVHKPHISKGYCGFLHSHTPKGGDPAAQTIAQRREAIYPQGLGTEHMTDFVPLRKKSWHQWDKVRQRIFKRDCGLCQVCNLAGRIKVGTEIDHIVAVTNGGTDEECNLQVICSECHLAKNDKDLGHKPRVTTGLDGWPVASGTNPRPLWKRQGYR